MQPVPYLTRSSFFPAIVAALDAAGADFAEVKVYLGPRGYERDETIEVPGPDAAHLLTSWRGDPGRFSARIRAAATVLHGRGIHGRFRAIHKDGVLTLRRPAARTILWRRIDQPGHDAARLRETADGWHLAGTAVFLHEDRPCHLAYEVHTDREWRTTAATVTGWVGSEAVDARVEADGRGAWTLNGTPSPQGAGCIDVDLNFSPSTNLLPIRRLALADGKHAAVRAAWLRFPSFALEPLEQTYRRDGANVYHYESAGGRFRRTLEVDEAGFVLDYPGIWIAEPAREP